MFEKIYKFSYGFISLGFIEIGSFISKATDLMNFGIFMLQALVGILTIVKLYKDVKAHKFVSTEKTQKSVEKKHPFLFGILKIFKK